MNQGNGVRKQLFSLLGSKSGKGFALGVGATLVATALIPTVAKALRPLAVQVTQGAIDITEKAVAKGAQLKENVEDIVAEAQFKHYQEKVATEQEQEVSCQESVNNEVESVNATKTSSVTSTVTTAPSNSAIVENQGAIKAQGHLEIAPSAGDTPKNGKNTEQGDT
ncbi:hypothetical protein F9B85_11015 [Heliorestis acidaminivorans]|uniref:DUF5132 domain-containing protein n=1 Tax=Heliorestis acidaminivorans TaxID=553427 RepID=A0A6I0EX90_9FIRM|nr:hypothetical protein [Heliorestis acidaminivorans]KAB2951814.1 hypothetical protein F9B85_11015 [Heliorestis acidaminivorans]